MEEWLGIGNIEVKGDEIFAEAALPAGEVLFSKILGFGDGIRVLSPAALAEEVQTRADAILRSYKKTQ